MYKYSLHYYQVTWVLREGVFEVLKDGGSNRSNWPFVPFPFWIRSHPVICSINGGTAINWIQCLFSCSMWRQNADWFGLLSNRGKKKQSSWKNAFSHCLLIWRMDGSKDKANSFFVPQQQGQCKLTMHVFNYMYLFGMLVSVGYWKVTCYRWI